MTQLRGEFLRQRWPTSLRAEINRLANLLSPVAGDLERGPATSADIASWLAHFHHDAAQIEPPANVIRRQLGLASRD
ncbi:MAG TPA: hypothetical protein VK277_13725 [Acidimicrobiales bacterium]|nr:hypothetical protein [Acidimicrobiales bacterium]